jgi:hypothetical protein
MGGFGLDCTGSNSAAGLAEGFSNFQATGMTPSGSLSTHQTIQESMRLIMLVRAYQVMSVRRPPRLTPQVVSC